MPGISLGSRLYISTYLPRMKRYRRWQYSRPIEFTPRWYTHPPTAPAPPPDPLETSFSDPSLPLFLNCAVSIVLLACASSKTRFADDPSGKWRSSGHCSAFLSNLVRVFPNFENYFSTVFTFFFFFVSSVFTFYYNGITLYLKFFK